MQTTEQTDGETEGQTGRQADMKKLIFFLGNSANTPENHSATSSNVLPK